MARSIGFVNQQYNKQFNGYFDLYEWSVSSVPDFWAAIWDFVDVKASRKHDKVAEDLNEFPGTWWLQGAWKFLRKIARPSSIDFEKKTKETSTSNLLKFEFELDYSLQQARGIFKLRE